MLAQETFLRCVERFERAKENVLSDWINDFNCENIGVTHECIECPIVELGQRIQSYIQNHEEIDSSFLVRECILLPKERREKRKLVNELYQQGLTYSMISEQTGMTFDTTHSWIKDVRITPPRIYSNEVKQHCIQLHAEGLSYRAITAMTGVCTSSVYHWVCAAGTLNRTTLREKHYNELRLQALQMKFEGMNHQQIAERLNISPTSVENWSTEIGLPIGKSYRPHDPQLKQLCLKMMDQGCDRFTVSQQTSVPQNTLRRWQANQRALQQPQNDSPRHPGVSCPHCFGQRVIKTGRNGGKQVYRCRGCQQHFLQPISPSNS